jgi:hypothetical protein
MELSRHFRSNFDSAVCTCPYCFCKMHDFCGLLRNQHPRS